MMRAILQRSRLATPKQYLRWKASQAVESPAASAAATATKDTAVKEVVPVGASLAAAFCGVATVSTAAAVVEYSTADSCLPYSRNGQRFSQDDFAGRFCRMLLACDPRLLLYSEEHVRQAKSLIDTADNYRDDRSMDRTLWEARRIADAALHPDTGEVIPRPFRMSGYVPYNGPICVAMVASTSTMPLLFWNWVNQSQNALVNYYNRNASSPMTNETLLKSYSAAVGSALVVAFGLSTIIQKRYPAEKARQLMKFVAFPSAVVASSLNCYIVRSPEIESGVPLMDQEGNNVWEGETSVVAATNGVNSTTVSRAILQAPVYFFPPVLMGVVGPLRSFLARNPHSRVPVTTFLLLTIFGVGLPATVAIFPQIVSITPDQVESKFQHLRDPKTQQPYAMYYYNKGL